MECEEWEHAQKTLYLHEMAMYSKRKYSTKNVLNAYYFPEIVWNAGKPARGRMGKPVAVWMKMAAAREELGYSLRGRWARATGWETGVLLSWVAVVCCGGWA